MITALVILGLVGDLADALYFQMYSYEQGFRFWNPATWSQAASYWDYMHTPLGAALSIAAIGPWIVLMLYLWARPCFSDCDSE